MANNYPMYGLWYHMISLLLKRVCYAIDILLSSRPRYRRDISQFVLMSSCMVRYMSMVLLSLSLLRNCNITTVCLRLVQRDEEIELSSQLWTGTFGKVVLESVYAIILDKSTALEKR
ncbi:hypothetical protein BDN72DRAFT_627817 [Pluteus cervinus]|uniref:Uncharacterized protein n=1 Tax=Pluteus cervinus TaxID=181527 RepID=A0ACD3A059_9AGAR|nr:hypothetical protein BDN72DRAFT_627817 [Pluteus cervinus]